jgi:putative ABC transport system ATP-binding protein
MIQLRSVTKNYRVGGQNVRALDSVDLEIAAGEFVSVVGPSGAGKSTLLHIVGALDTPDSGSVRFRDEDITNLGEREQAAFRLRRIGFVFQFFNLLPTMSAWENVALPKLLNGTSLRSAKAGACTLLETVGLADRVDHRPSELSGGQMQRVAVARALVMDPDVILADEPTGNLDSMTGAGVLSLLSMFANDSDRPRAVVMVTHNEQATTYTNRVIRMQDGRVRDDAVIAEGAIS